MAKFCGGCGHEVPETSKFCPACGTSLAQEPPQAMSFEGVAYRPTIQQIGTINVGGMGKVDEAEPRFGTPAGSPGVYLRLGYTAYDSQNYGEALHYFDQALALNPNNEGSWVCRGVVLIHLGRRQEAVASLYKVLAFRPDRADAWNHRGVALANLRRYREAVASFDKALALKPDHTYAWFDRGVALRSLGREQEAQESFKKCEELRKRGT